MGLILFTLLSQAAMLGMQSWCTLDFVENHYGWPANQPLESYTRLFIPIPPYATALQIIANDSRTAYVRDAMVLRDYVYVEFEYWYQTCQLHIGWQNGTGDCHGVQIFEGIKLF